MDSIIKKAADGIKKHRYALLILLLGVVLMLIPTSKSNDEAPAQEPDLQETADLGQELEQILSAIDGVGKVQVLLTVNSGPVTVYRTDEDGTVIVTDDNRAQNGLIEHTEAESYRGAVVVCQGADRAQVRLSVIEAVSKATGLGADRIVVLKMK